MKYISLILITHGEPFLDLIHVQEKQNIMNYATVLIIKQLERTYLT